MPVKFIALAALVALAAGYAVYENEELRSEISQFMDRQRRKMAQKLREFAEELSPKEQDEYEQPMLMGSRPGTGVATGTDSGGWGDGGDQELRRRGAGAGAGEVVFDRDAEKEKMNEKEGESGYETMEKELPELPAAATPLRRTASSSVASTATLAGALPENHLPLATAPLDPLANSQPYWSIPTWAENTTGGSGSNIEVVDDSSEPSLAGSDEEDVEEVEVDLGEDAMSETPPMSETSEEFEDVGSIEGSLAGWSEVGSEVSGEEEEGRGRF